MQHSVILLFGGDSKERMVSVATAQHVIKAMHHPQAWFWDLDDKVYEVSFDELSAHRNPFHSPFNPKSEPTWMSLKAALDSTQAKQSVLFVGFHGGMGEDGTVQKWMEARGLAFTGSGSEACRLAFDKTLGKHVVEGFGIRVAEAVTVSGRQLAEAEQTLRSFLTKHGKMAVKPVADGSSVGLSIVDSEEGIRGALAHIAASPHMTFMAEAFVSGIELTIGVIDDRKGPRALPATEIRPMAGRLFDYNGKYLGEGVKEVTPAEVPDHILHAAQRVALTAHSAFGCDGYSRTDIIIDSQGPVFLETNTLPGLTEASLVPQQLAVDGMSLRAFVDLQVELAIEKANLARSSDGRPASV